MSRIRFTKTTEPNIPSTNKSSLYVDVTDNHLKRKKDDGSVVDYDLGNQEGILDTVGQALVDSDTIEFTYDDLNDTITADIKDSSIDSTHVNSISPTKIIDGQNGRYQSSVITNSSTPVQFLSLDCSEDGTWMVELRILNETIGGLAGNTDHSAVFKKTFRVKTRNSSVTVHDLQSDYTSRDNDCNINISISGTNIIIFVYGEDNTNIRWKGDVITNYM